LKYFKPAGATELDNNSFCCAYDLLQVPEWARGGRKNKTRKRRTSAPARKKKYARTFFVLFLFFLVRFWAFLGKGSSKTREKIEYVSEKNTGEIFFLEFVSGGFFNFFPFDFFCCVG
jgi:hypothetical protein